MNITVKQLVEIHKSLTALSNVKTSLWYTVTKNLAKTKPPFNAYLEIETIAAKNTAEMDENGNPIFDSAGNLIFQTASKETEFDEIQKKELSEVIEVEFYQTKITPEFINESHASALIEPLIDIILIE